MAARRSGGKRMRLDDEDEDQDEVSGWLLRYNTF